METSSTSYRSSGGGTSAINSCDMPFVRHSGSPMHSISVSPANWLGCSSGVIRRRTRTPNLRLPSSTLPASTRALRTLTPTRSLAAGQSISQWICWELRKPLRSRTAAGSSAGPRNELPITAVLSTSSAPAGRLTPSEEQRLAFAAREVVAQNAKSGLKTSSHRNSAERHIGGRVTSRVLHARSTLRALCE